MDALLNTLDRMTRDQLVDRLELYGILTHPWEDVQSLRQRALIRVDDGSIPVDEFIS